MTAYVSAAAGAYNVGTNWTPNGIPNSADTATVNHIMTIPNGYAAEIGAITINGSGSGARGGFVITGGGSLKHFGAITVNNWNSVSATGTGIATWDLNGNNATYSQQSTASIHNNIINTSSALFHIKSTGAESNIMAASFQPSDGLLDISNFIIEKVSMRYGGGFFSGNHYRVRNGVFYNHGFVRTAAETNAASDFIVRYCDFRLASSLDGGAYAANFSCLTSAGAGLREFHHLTFQYASQAIVRTERFSFITPSQIYVDNVAFENVLSPSTNWTNVFHARVNFGELGLVDLVDSYVTPNIDNPHTYGLVKNLTQVITEAFYPGGATDGGDHLILDNNTHVLSNCIFIDGRGGVILNALGVAVTGTYTLDHCTYVADVADSVYGQLVRNETGGSFAAGATTTIRNNIAYVRSGNTNNRVYNIETAGNDQIDYLDYNSYSGEGTTNATLYYQVTSATKGAIGSQAGWGLNDSKTENPDFVAPTRGLLSWGAQFGAVDYDDCVDYILDGLNGYNRVAHDQTGTITGNDVNTLVDYVKAGFAPTNIFFKDSGSDGVTRGAVEYQAASSGSGGMNKLFIGISI
jgi:hypothetical protein